MSSIALKKEVRRAFGPSAQDKMQFVNDMQGNAYANLAQGTTSTIYDSIALDGGSNVFNFFQNTSGKPTVLSNVTQGMLTSMETATILEAQIQFVEFTSSTDFTVVSISPLVSSLQFQQGWLDIMVGNQRVLKTMALQTWVDKFNSNAGIPGQNVFQFDTDIVLPSFQEFRCAVTLAKSVALTNVYAKFIIKGVGGIFAAKSNY